MDCGLLLPVAFSACHLAPFRPSRVDLTSRSSHLSNYSTSFCVCYGSAKILRQTDLAHQMLLFLSSLAFSHRHRR
eukprot:5640782-Pleurochrysis_carterae.AAC.1